MTQGQITLRILTPDGSVFDGAAEAVFLPGSKGPFEVLPEHTPVITSLDPGRLVWRSGGSENALEIRGGAAILDKNILTVCVQVENR